MRADFLSPDATNTARRQPRSVAEKLRDAVRALAGGHGDIVHHVEKAWASITFAGTRHIMRLVFDGDGAVEAGEGLIADLPEHEFAIPGQLVADATVAAVEHELLPHPRLLVECEVLLLEDA